MISRMLQWSAALLLGAMVVAGPATAIPITTVGGPYVANTVDTFDANPGSLGSEVPFTHDYSFTGLSALGSSALASVLLPFPPAGQPGIADLYIYWLKPDLSVLTFQQLTD